MAASFRFDIQSVCVLQCFHKFIQVLSAPVGLEIDNSEESVDQDLNSSSLSTLDDSLPSVDCPLSNISCLGQQKVSENEANTNLCAILNSKALSVSPRQTYGCGQAYLVSKIEEHYGNECKKRLNKLPT